MPVPLAIHQNTIMDHPSSTMLLQENGLKIKGYSQDIQWNTVVPKLSIIVLNSIAKNFANKIIFYELTQLDRENLQNLLSTDLDFELAVSFVESEFYWKKRYGKHFGPILHHTNLGWTWKSLYLEEYLLQNLENFETEYHNEETLKKILNLICPYIHNLSIKKLQKWTILPCNKLPKNYQEINKDIVTKNLENCQELLEKCQKSPENCQNPSIDDSLYELSFISLLKYLPNLVKLDISDVEISQNLELTIEDCEKLGNVIQSMKNLKILRLQRREITCKYVQVLLKKLVKNYTLVELDLSNCKIGDLGAKLIGLFLNIHEEIKVLKLRNNIIGPDGVLGIAYALIVPEGSRLDILDLSLNPLGRIGCMTLMRALMRGVQPRDLSIAGCNIDGDVVHIGSMLMANCSLRKLDVSGNKLGLAGGKAILGGIKNNRGLQILNMIDTCIPNGMQEKIQKILKRNWRNGQKSLEDISQFIFFDKLIKNDRTETGIDLEILQTILDLDGENDYYYFEKMKTCTIENLL